MAIFIGRNIEDHSRLWLIKNKIDFIEQPLIHIQLVKPNYSFFAKIAKQKKHWIITSQWAAKWLQLYHSTIGFKSDDSVFCLSKKQATIVGEFAEVVFVSQEKNFRALTKLLYNENGLKIFLKGNRASNTFGLDLIEVEVYQNSLTRPMLEKEFETYLFFSPSGIESFIQGGNTLPDYSTIITIGETTAEKARSKFSNAAVVSPRQDELKMIQLATCVKNREQLNSIENN